MLAVFELQEDLCARVRVRREWKTEGKGRLKHERGRRREAASLDLLEKVLNQTHNGFVPILAVL